MSEIRLTAKELEEMIEKSANKGAMQALQSIGLHDENAPADIRDLRAWIISLRTLKKEAWKTFLKEMWRFITAFATVFIITYLFGKHPQVQEALKAMQ